MVDVELVRKRFKLNNEYKQKHKDISVFELFPLSWFDLSEKKKLELLTEALEKDKLLGELDFFMYLREIEAQEKLKKVINETLSKKN